MATCEHTHAYRVGHTTGPVQAADPAVDGLMVHTVIQVCPACTEFLTAVTLRPRRGGSEWTTGQVVLRAARQVVRDG